MLSHWLSTAEHVLRHCGSGDLLVRIVNIIYVSNIYDVIDVSNISYVRNVDQAQIVATVVVPGEEGIEGTQREPSNQIHAN
jgi:hypothetical protein